MNCERMHILFMQSVRTKTALCKFCSFLFYEQLFQFNLFPIKDAYHARVRVQAASLFRALCSSAYAALGRTRINRSQLPVAERTPRALHGTSRQPGTANRSHTATRVW